ncbi:flagellar biosynthesis repressor FlbT [Roseomonas marmotae]|uniref:Flagellar biosynthesis repressor FlbT n=1 Tax=Roseomonas marmotae TaxID=2768161 RepID=A0ABS3K967_9PROT|nr:flagellar biosynthesis repressor FlbT [Roseomonas marmotae]MBO1073173.1 flagellar biosynthesis repressor FlbT [Roseomonas marmotae]QTI79193.1 flagellar biosynthesis repressor FlbT [Roseomonas marmotae]
MTTLVLELRPGDLLIVNGAPIRFRSRTRVELAGRARFLFGKQVMVPEAATTLSRRFYLALQTAYVGPEDERGEALLRARALQAEYQASVASQGAKDLMLRALALSEECECYQALKLVRRVIQQEEAASARPVPDRLSPGAWPGHVPIET